jgi:methionyl-tRNA formyltransferase
LPAEILSIPKYGCLNIHPSLLPKYRGASPIQYAILQGDKKTGATLMVMDPSFDTGAILAQSEFELDGTETFGDLANILAELGGEMIKTVLPLYLDQSIKPIPQDDTLASQAPKITKENRWLNPKDSPEVNERKVRAFAPSPGAFIILDGQQIKVLESHIENNNLVFDRIVPAGKQPMTWEEFKRGYRKTIHFDSLKVGGK